MQVQQLFVKIFETRMHSYDLQLRRSKQNHSHHTADCQSDPQSDFIIASGNVESMAAHTTSTVEDFN